MTAPTPIWMPVYVADYLADTGHLSTIEHGAYWLLLLHYWRNGEVLPDDPAALCRITKLTREEWERHGDTLRALFQPKGGKLAHKRVERELAEAFERMSARSHSARTAANARWEKMRDASETDADAMPDASNTDAEGMRGDAQLQSQLQSSVPKGTAAGPHGIAGAKAAIFREGLAYLTDNGVPDKQARTLLGKWRKDSGDGAVLDILGRAATEGVSKPVPWIEASLKPKKGGRSEAVI